jgi:hypothetical protein
MDEQWNPTLGSSCIVQMMLGKQVLDKEQEPDIPFVQGTLPQGIVHVGKGGIPLHPLCMNYCQ